MNTISTVNMDVRMTARMGAVPLWQLADALNMSEPTLYRKLRKPLTDAERQKYFSAINKIMAERAGKTSAD